MTPDRALDRITKLLALAGPTSGATQEERRTAAVEAVRLMAEHGIVPGTPSAIDLDDVTALSIRVLELERLLASERVSCAARLRERDEQWRRVVEQIRREGQAERRKATKLAARKGAGEAREAQARAGGEARDHMLSDERKKEIGRAAASARWARWRERFGPKSIG